ncbi:unnamed protein product [Effrenium voratum]|uniref:DNA topoisomerase (ATP-hydrolyzing) n=1 Tax=Effrenium voratum TaxID=2562239 RepID=A0AA36J8E0_9DINO|nr:unnamed protein product [Effrenium voratum]
MGLQKRLFGVPKLEDANLAGTKEGHSCTLILTEGDSAKALAVAGLSVVGRDRFGVFPLRGKLRNVRELSVKQMLENKEIDQVLKILALDANKEYRDAKGLRYGSIMIMTDQDHDGSHIKGLIINFIQHWFPSLLRMPGFLKEFVTPIVKVSKGDQSKTFFTLPEYEAWKEANNNGQGWKVKYYKGLGTSTSAEAREYFADIDDHEIRFTYSGNRDDDLIDMAFAAKRSDERKTWISQVEDGTFVDHSQPTLSYTDFIEKELSLFAKYDVERAVPSMVDGLKPGQRKVLFGCFKKKLSSEIKVAQLSGYVAENSAYHHGEASLQGTIIGMAQTFVGSNNINLLEPRGQFGSRLQGGKDHAASRYIFTCLSKARVASAEASMRADFLPERVERLLHWVDASPQRGLSRGAIFTAWRRWQLGRPCCLLCRSSCQQAIGQVNLVLRAEFNSYLEDADALSTYSFRRVAPTLGSLLKFSGTELCALGDWQDRSQLGEESRMPMHYSGARYLLSFKQKFVALPVAAAKRKAELSVIQDMPDSINGIMMSAFMRNGRRLCGPFQLDACKEGEEVCGRAHLCAVLQTGRVCGGRHHGQDCKAKRVVRASSVAEGKHTAPPALPVVESARGSKRPRPKQQAAKLVDRSGQLPTIKRARQQEPSSASRAPPVPVEEAPRPGRGGESARQDQHFDDLARQGRKDNLGDFPAVALQVTAFKQKPQERGGLVLPGVMQVLLRCMAGRHRAAALAVLVRALFENISLEESAQRISRLRHIGSMRPGGPSFIW